MSEETTGGRRAAFFDVDKTILTVNSGTKWVEYMRRNGQMSLPQLVRSVWWLVQYRAGVLDFDAMTQKAIRPWAGRSVAQLREEVAQWYQADIAQHISSVARERVEAHRSAGDVVVILTSATRFLSEPLCAELGIEHILCTEVAEAEGKIAGTIVPPSCYGEGKVVRAEAFAKQHEIDLDVSTFYTDSYTDLPMLLRVKEPFVVNPDPRLKRHARQSGWPVENWT